MEDATLTSVAQACTYGFLIRYVQLCKFAARQEAEDRMADGRLSVRGRQLARQLRRLRAASQFTGDEAASRLGWSGAKISRIENAHSSIKVADLRMLLDLYAVPADEGERLIELARTANKRGWWDAYADNLPSEYAMMIGLEEEATSKRVYANSIIDGLLQTRDYAREITEAALFLHPPQEIDQRVEIRMNRQRRLDEQNNSLQLWMILDEAALMRNVGGNAVMRAQLEHLGIVAQKPNVVLQVLPFEAGAHAAPQTAFTIFEFPHFPESEVVTFEISRGDLYIEDTRDVYRYILTFNALLQKALGPNDSLEFISQLANEK
jgi:transcriptional regulator with XRE-family HTH domain